MIFITGGGGNNGKSSLVELMGYAFGCCAMIIANDALCSSKEAKSHKFVDRIQQHSRAGTIADMKNERVNASLFKNLVGDNEIENEVIFGTYRTIALNLKLLIASNYDFRSDVDES